MTDASKASGTKGTFVTWDDSRVNHTGPTTASLTIAAFICLFGAGIVSAQDVKKSSLVGLGEATDLRFVEIDGETYVSWADLNSALPDWFSVNANGQVELSAALRDFFSRGPSAAGEVSITSSNIVESRIDGEFEGWEGDTIFQLVNGQIWQQAEYAYHYKYKYMPRVMIVRTSRGWIMSVDGVSKQIRVRRIR